MNLSNDVSKPPILRLDDLDPGDTFVRGDIRNPRAIYIRTNEATVSAVALSSGFVKRIPADVSVIKVDVTGYVSTTLGVEVLL